MNKSEERAIQIAKLEANQNNMAQQLEDLKNTVIDWFSDIKKDIKDFKTECNNTYASKSVERIVYWLVWLILSAVAVAILWLVIKKLDNSWQKTVINSNYISYFANKSK